jgi:TRAP-type mannitol/chloroaromatic compound transport system permease small subunit
MKILLKYVHLVDWLSENLGKIAAWTVLLSAGISAGNAFIRYGIDWSSNAMLEIQWYLFAWMVMVGAPLVLKLNEHVRVDLIYGKLKGHAPVYVDIFGLICFLLPVMAIMAYMCAPYFWKVFVTGEGSDNAGGLIRWPVILALPVGFAMVFLQGIAEIIKRIAYLQGHYAMDTNYEKPLQ